MKSNSEYKKAALGALKGHWAPAVLVAVVFFALMYLSMGPYGVSTVKVQTYMRENMPQVYSSGSMGASFSRAMKASLALAQDSEYLALQQKASGSMGLFYLLLFLVILPFTVGVYNAFRLLLVQGDDALLANSCRIATKGYWHKVWGMFLMELFVALWSLLFLIPGIVKMFSYAMTPFILEENPELTANEAIDRSRAMMKGHKFDLFWLYLSFIGWFLLGMITLGVAYLWIYPYIQTATAAFYEDVKADYEVNGGLI